MLVVNYVRLHRNPHVITLILSLEYQRGRVYHCVLEKLALEMELSTVQYTLFSNSLCFSLFVNLLVLFLKHGDGSLLLMKFVAHFCQGLF